MMGASADEQSHSTADRVVAAQCVLAMRAHFVWREIRLQPEPWGVAGARQYAWAVTWAQLLLPLIAFAAARYYVRWSQKGVRWSGSRR